MAKIKISDEVVAVLNECTVVGNNIKLPATQLDRATYVATAKQLELIGGKWKGGKVLAFVFASDPTELLKEIQGGEGRNLKKEFQFFATPSDLANKLVGMANIEEGHIVLEPSAGQGALIEAIYRAFPRTMTGPNDKPCVTVDYYEIMPVNIKILSDKGAANTNWRSRTSNMGEDFLANNSNFTYDRVIANPPFSLNQDIKHIYKMFDMVKPGGRLVTLASQHWANSQNSKEKMFVKWLEYQNAAIIKLSGGEFKESGTNIAACIIIIDK